MRSVGFAAVVLVCISACGRVTTDEVAFVAAEEGAGGDANSFVEDSRALDGGGASTASACYGPRQNLGQAVYDDWEGGCPCQGEPVCALGDEGDWFSLHCDDGQWRAVYDGVCARFHFTPSCTLDGECPEGQACTIKPPYNERICISSEQPATGECTCDAECASDEVCASAVLGDAKQTCLSASCRTDADCSDEPDGSCIWTGGGSCSGDPLSSRRTAALACVYPGSWCRNDTDCAAPTPYCVVERGRARCAASCGAP